MLRTYIHVFQEAVQKVCDTLPWINAIGPIKDYDDVQLGFTLCNINCHIRIDSNKDQTYLTAPATFVTNNKCIPFCSGAELTCLMPTIIVFHMACVPFIRKGFSCDRNLRMEKVHIIGVFTMIPYLLQCQSILLQFFQRTILYDLYVYD